MILKRIWSNMDAFERFFVASAVPCLIIGCLLLWLLGGSYLAGSMFGMSLFGASVLYAKWSTQVKLDAEPLS